MHSFKNRLLILIVALMAFAEGVTIVLALAYLRQGVQSQSAQQLTANRSVAERLLQERGGQLRAAADVLVADFGFREAATSGDRDTVLSALGNHALRLDAQIAVLYDQQGEVIASTARLPAGFDPPLSAAEESTSAAPDYAVLDNRPYQLVFAPLRAPEVVGYVALGFAVDEKVAQQLKSIVGADVSFLSRAPAGPRAVSSTLPFAQSEQLRDQLRLEERDAGPHDLTLGGEQFLWESATLPAREGEVELVVQRSLDDAFAVFRQMRVALLLIGAASLAAAMLVAWRAGHGAVRPLGALVAAAQRMQQGDYAQPIAAVGPGEFQQLAESFNAMQSAIREREARIFEQATHDSLTGLPNRFAFRDWLAAQSGRGETICVALLDLHRFRDINASVGHRTADQLLCALAQRFQRLASGSGRCARVGVDQFLIALADREPATLRLLRLLAEELRRGIAVGDIAIVADLRAGVVEWDARQTSAEDVLRQADVALVEAKETGAVCAVYQPSHDAEQQRRVLLVSELRKAIASNGLHLNFQPLVLMTTREAVSFEALVRWTHPKLGPIPPSEFVPLAERASAVADLSRWVLAAAIRQLGAWRRDGIDLELAVNLSASDLSDADLPARVLSLLHEHGVEPRQLMLEVTESAIMHEPETAARIMQQLRSAGLKFAIDDFGTGHSSLAQLHTLPVDEIKIDRSFVINLDRSANNQAIVRSTTELGHILGLRVVAEGIETPQAWSSLLRLGCDLAQGYFISRPMPGADVPGWLATQRANLSRALAEAHQEGTVAALKLRPPPVGSP